MEKEGVKQVVKREVVRAVLERIQSMDMEKLGAPRAEDAVHFDNVEEILNIPYMNRDEVPLGMDIFKPVTEENAELPVIVTIHGGGLTMGDRKISRPFARVLAHKGYLVFSIEYRLAPRANVCMQLDDVCAGLDLVGRKLVDYNVDFQRIFLAAESAGAYLAAYVTAMKGSKKLQEAIGYEPTRVIFKAVGLMSGMLYTNRNALVRWLMADQLYGEKRADANFLQYMNPEHPEILNNLPPTFFITSKEDVLNNYSVTMHEAMKRAGKPCKLLYYANEELQHSFTTLQTELPDTIDSIDRMLAWFEEQARIAADREKTAKSLARKTQKLIAAMQDGTLNDQKIWQYIKRRAELEPERLYLPAILDCSGTYTYGQMFAQWDRYARVFSAMGITDTKNSRVALVGSVDAEPLFAFYALNMTGASVSMFSYPDLLPGGRWKTMVEKEHITDMVISDIMVSPQMWAELRKAKAEFGLRNIILLHTRMGGPCLGYAEMLYNEFNYNALKRLPDVQYMDALLEQHKDHAIHYGRKGGDHLAVICHTSGTTNGTRKPLPYTDRMVNALTSADPSGMLRGVKQKAPGDNAANPKVDGMEWASTGRRQMTMILPFDLSAASMINGFATMTFASGNAVVTTCFGFLHPKFVRAFKYYKVDIGFISGFMLDGWMKQPELDADAFSSVKVFGFGGSYISPAKMEKYEAFLKAHGFTGIVSQAYGMSELCGSMLFVPPGCREDILGYPDNPEFYRILDEEDGKFHRLSEGEREGVLYGRSNSMCQNTLDGETLFELTAIDGQGFVCMNDVVHANPDGSLSYVGRSNQFFANNEGVKFDSGIVETQLLAHPNIDLCAIVPLLDKRIHDTVPVLYAIPADKDRDGAEQVRQALADIYVRGTRLKDSVLPTQFVLVDHIPLSATGKVDIYHITRSRIDGNAYNILPVKHGGALIDIQYESAEGLNSYTAGTLPEGMGKDSAFGVFDIFSVPAKQKSPAASIKKYRETMKEHREKWKAELPDLKALLPKMKIPGVNSEMRGMPSVAGLPEPLRTISRLSMVLMNDQEVINRDFEE